MRKPMTIEEMKELLKISPDGVELICDDGEFTDNMSKIKVTAINDRYFLSVDSYEKDDFCLCEDLRHYPSQKPEKTIYYKWVMQDSDGNLYEGLYFMSKGGMFPRGKGCRVSAKLIRIIEGSGIYADGSKADN